MTLVAIIVSPKADTQFEWLERSAWNSYPDPLRAEGRVRGGNSREVIIVCAEADAQFGML